MIPIQQGEVFEDLFFAHDANGDAVTGKVDGDWTKQLSKNAATFTVFPTGTTITERSGGWYHVQYSAADTDTRGLMTAYFTASGVKQVNLQYRVIRHIQDNSPVLKNIAEDVQVLTGASTTVIPTDLTEATADHYNGRIIIFNSGSALAGQATDITDYAGTSKQLTVTALTEAPAPGDTFNII